ncbi:MAG: FeoB-associated Cys-rich membrane protein [Victivallaceae bacterium]|nr:FeoB-associated Cys-rich membrane protein [Victivallaceae bacterium]
MYEYIILAVIIALAVLYIARAILKAAKGETSCTHCNECNDTDLPSKR